MNRAEEEKNLFDDAKDVAREIDKLQREMKTLKRDSPKYTSLCRLSEELQCKWQFIVDRYRELMH